jgi:hypothetical protein
MVLCSQSMRIDEYCYTSVALGSTLERVLDRTNYGTERKYRCIVIGGFQFQGKRDYRYCRSRSRQSKVKRKFVDSVDHIIQLAGMTKVLQL